MNRTVRRIGALCAVLVSTVGILSAQEAVTDPAYIIDSVEYRIEGRTRQWILEDLLDLDAGTAFPDRESLIAYMARQQQVLVNQRALQDATVVAEYDDGEAALPRMSVSAARVLRRRLRTDQMGATPARASGLLLLLLRAQDCSSNLLLASDCSYWFLIGPSGS